MKIAIVQLNVESGKCESNFKKIKQYIAQAKQDAVDLIVFPEMCIGGSLLQDQLLDHEFCVDVASYTNKIKALSNNIGIIFGNLYYDSIENISQDKKVRCNAVFFAYNETWVKKENNHFDGMEIKQENIDTHFLDDSRYFLSGSEIASMLYQSTTALLSPFLFNRENKSYRIGLTIGDDTSHQVHETLINQRVDYIIHVSNTPYTIHKMDNYIPNKQDNNPYLIYATNCGMLNNGKNVVLFDGNSRIYDPQGELVCSLNDAFKEEYKPYDFVGVDISTPCKNKVVEALTTAIQEFDRQIFPFHPKWIIGLSGGIDSSVNAALLVKALGSERVIGYNLASKYNSITTKNNARLLAEHLHIEIREGSIETLYQATIDTMKSYKYNEVYPSLVSENIQARLRGHLLATFASIEGGVVINNGNKIEAALGYCTLYGDSIGALAPLGDITKVQVFEIARELNQYFNKEIISNSLIPSVENDKIVWEMPPSAELKDEQLDPMKWYYHDLILQKILENPSEGVENIMESYLDKSIYSSEIGKWIWYYKLDNSELFIKDLEWVLYNLHNAVFKRIQMPPIVSLSSGAFGNDYREAQLGFIQTQKYKNLKNKILSL